MGTTAWSDAHYRSRAAHRRRMGRSAFGYNEDIRAGRMEADVHEKMDPARMKRGVRESRDSDAHPNSNAVAVLFDVTGSMLRAPRIVQQSLCTLFGLTLRKGYLDDPAILVGAVGDATCDLAPLQVGQFESGNEIEDDLDRLFLEGGGGGQKRESYELALYFLARKTSLDCVERRGKRGYAFLIGDEMPYPRVKRREVERVFGDRLQADIPIRDILDEARQKFEIYYVLPNLTSYFRDQEVFGCWQALLGQYALRLKDPAGVSELIASTIGLAEDAVAPGDIGADLRDTGANKRVAAAVSAALANVPAGTAAPFDSKGTGLAAF